MLVQDLKKDLKKDLKDLNERMEEIARDCMGDAPSYCVATCPLHVDARGYIKHIAEGNYKESVKLIREKLPFPAIMGRICAHPCEEKCKRNELNQPMAIAALKRFAAQYDEEADWDLTKEDATGKKVAVIGLGPAGALAAYDLAKKGHDVTVFEALPVMGGMLRVGIPAYRLPREIIDREFSILEKLGVNVRLNTRVGTDITFEDLQKEFDAVLITVGSHKSAMLNIPGSDLAGILPGVDFLRDASLGNKVELGKRVVVIGGGNVAIDVARTAWRLGADEVELVCLERDYNEMPAHSWEIEDAEKEGVKINCGWGPKEFLGDNGRVKGVSLKKCTAVFNSEGKFSPEYDENTTRTIEADNVIIAIGQITDSSFIPEQLGIERIRGSKFVVNPMTLETNVKGVFAAGDAAGPPLLAVEAMAAGRKAAISIDRFLKGQDMTIDREYEGAYETWLETEIPENTERLPRVEMPTIPVEKRKGNFNEVELGLTEEQARREAERCLECECKLCVKECEFLADVCEYPKELMKKLLEDPYTDIKLPYYCNLCKTCTVHCPKDFEISEIMLDLRRKYVREGKAPLPEHKPVYKFHQRFGVSSLFTLTYPDRKAGFTKRVFFPGCSFPSYSPELVTKTLAYLQEKLPGTGFVLRCCGAPTYALGQEKRFREIFDSLLAEIQKLGAEEIICACPDCTHNIEHHAPSWLKVSSLYVVLDEIGIPQEAKDRGRGRVFSIHDSCSSRDYSDIQESVRNLITEMGYKIQEMKNIKGKTRCCGFGGMVVPINPELSLRNMKRRVSETDKDIITYCAACRESMIMGGGQALHILDLIFNDKWQEIGIPGNTGTLKSWLNRWRTKSMVRKL